MTKAKGGKTSSGAGKSASGASGGKAPRVENLPSTTGKPSGKKRANAASSRGH